MSRNNTLNQVSELLLNYATNKPLLVGLDGVDGAGKTYMADELFLTLKPKTERQIVRISIDDFHNPRSIRYAKGKDSSEGFYQDSYDYEQFIKYVIKPLKTEGNHLVRTAIHDCDNDCKVDGKRIQISDDAIVLIDGIFLHRSVLRQHWDLTILVKTDFDISVPRANARISDNLDSNPYASVNARYVKGQEIYFKDCDPESKATIVINNNSLESAYILTNRLL